MGTIENIFGLGIGGLVALKTLDIASSALPKPKKKRKKMKRRRRR